MEASWCKREFHHDGFGWKLFIQVYLSCVWCSLSLSFPLFLPIRCLSVDLSFTYAVFLSFLPSILIFCAFAIFYYAIPSRFPPPSSHTTFHFLTYLLLSGACQVWAGFTWMAIFKYRPPLHIEVLSALFESKVMGDWIDLYGVIWWKSLIYIPDSLRWKNITHSVCLGWIRKRMNVLCGENTYSGIYMDYVDILFFCPKMSAFKHHCLFYYCFLACWFLTFLSKLRC